MGKISDVSAAADSFQNVPWGKISNILGPTPLNVF
jgi:hypothetical protein